MIIDEQDYLKHYGILRKSGRYPWGSGRTQTARNKTFLDTVEDLKRNGLSEPEIAKGYDMSTKQLRALKSIAANEQKQARINRAQRLKEKGLSNVAIGETMGINESSVRSLLNPGQKERADILQVTSSMLKDQIEKKDYIDIGRGVENQLGLTATRLATAVSVLQEEGYKMYWVKTPTGQGKYTTVKVLAKPGAPFPKGDQIQQITAFSNDGGRTHTTLRTPTNVASKRLAIAYKDDGGADKDGVIELRPNVEDLSLGASKYAQVRIAVDGTHYIKGMAIYNPDLPSGIDLRFNTNKNNTGNKLDALKPMERTKDPDGTSHINRENPFGASIKEGGQRGALNIIYEEGDWDKWSKNLPSQMLSKQKPDLAKTQLNLTYEQRRTSLSEIRSLTNPAIRKKLLESYADDVDSAAVHLKAAAMRNQATKVLLPVTSVKDTEIYAPSFRNGERVALIRFPHAGTFEIPQLTVNNRNVEAKNLLGTAAKDAVGIHPKVAERLSGADFDGDYVIVIPNNRGSVKSSDALDGLKGFDPRSAYPGYPGMVPIKSSRKQQEMGNVSNLITDMTIQGASRTDMARAVRHSMVVIDSEKHNLDFKGSAIDNGIAQLKTKYQGGPRAGAHTLISRASSPERVPERKPRPASEGGPIDKTTGKKVFVDTGANYVDSKGKTIFRQEKIARLANTHDAHTLVSDPSGTPIERVYADHSNRLKALANDARKEAVATKPIAYSPASKATYSKEVETLNAKLNLAKMNAPLERQARLLATAKVDRLKEANPDMDADDLKKIESRALLEMRNRTGAGKQRIQLTQTEWNAIQAGAISNNKLTQILNNSDLDSVRKLATPRTPALMTSTKTARAQAMLASGYTQSEIADALGVSLTTLKSGLA